MNRKEAILFLIACLIIVLVTGAIIINIITPGGVFNPILPTEPHMHP